MKGAIDFLAGIVGLSGYLPLADLVKAERSPANQRTPGTRPKMA